MQKTIGAAIVCLFSLSAASPGGSPCGDDICPSSEAKKLQDAWNSSLTTVDQKNMMNVFIFSNTKDGVTNWNKTAIDYFTWRNGGPYDPKFGTSKIQSAASTPDYGKMKKLAENYLRTRMIDPQSALFEWPHGFFEGTWKPIFQRRLSGYITCGFINAKNRLGGYVGRSAFVVVINNNDVAYADIGGNGGLDLTTVSCAKSASLLPPPQPEMADGPTPHAGPSVADELEKLQALREKGVITESEFQSQKAKVLRD